MPVSRADLLRPSLSEDGAAAVRRAPYSLQVGFLSAFFGGPLAAAAMVALNAWRLERLRRDAAWLLAVAVAAFGFYVVVQRSALFAEGLQALSQWAGPRALVYVERLFALALFGIGALLYRREQRSADLFGLARPNGWIAGIALIAGGMLAAWLVLSLLARP